MRLCAPRARAPRDATPDRSRPVGMVRQKRDKAAGTNRLAHYNRHAFLSLDLASRTIAPASPNAGPIRDQSTKPFDGCRLCFSISR
jgi:hypothetical protein